MKKELELDIDKGMVTKRDIGNWILELQEKSKGTFN